MSDPSSNWTAHAEDGHWLPGALLLFIALLISSAVLLPLAWWIGGPQGAKEVGVAALLCFVTGLLVLAVSSLQTLRRQPLAGLLCAMVLRLLPPLVVCLAIAVEGTQAEYFAFACYLSLFYLVSLAVETYLSVQQLQPTK